MAPTLARALCVVASVGRVPNPPLRSRMNLHRAAQPPAVFTVSGTSLRLKARASKFQDVGFLMRHDEHLEVSSRQPLVKSGGVMVERAVRALRHDRTGISIGSQDGRRGALQIGLGETFRPLSSVADGP